MTDLGESKIKGYRKILGQKRYKELHRAVGLASHGVGIGCLAYLRRVFEHVIDEAHRGATTRGDWNEGKYQAARMEEKIQLLKEDLPLFLVRNRKIYAILSKAIHELNEEECLAAYPVIRTGIELTLDAGTLQESLLRGQLPYEVSRAKLPKRSGNRKPKSSTGTTCAATPKTAGRSSAWPRLWPPRARTKLQPRSSSALRRPGPRRTCSSLRCGSEGMPAKRRQNPRGLP